MHFPTPWKAKIIGRRAFQPLGKQKSSDDALSNPLESKNHLTMSFRGLGKQKSSDDVFLRSRKAKILWKL